MADREISPDKTHWRTSEVAKVLGVSPSLVRTWIAYMAWEVQRNAEGHRVFSNEDVAQLEQLKAWLDAGHSLKEFRRERQGDGPYDPRLEMRSAFKRLKEIQSQEEALLAKHHELLASAEAQRAALLAQVAEMRLALIEAGAGQEGEAPFAGEPVRAVEDASVLAGELAQARAELAEAQARLAEREAVPAAGTDELEAALARARAEAQALTRQLAASEKALAETEPVEPYQRALDEAEKETAGLRERVASLQMQLMASGGGDELAPTLGELKRRVAEQETALAAAERARAEAEAAAAELGQRLAEAEAELPALRAAAAAAMLPDQQETSMLVQGVLKQLLSALLEKRGKLQLVRRYEEQGRPYLEFAAPGGRRQIVEDVCATEADQRLLETLLTVIVNG